MVNKKRCFMQYSANRILIAHKCAAYFPDWKTCFLIRHSSFRHKCHLTNFIIGDQFIQKELNNTPQCINTIDEIQQVLRKHYHNAFFSVFVYFDFFLFLHAVQSIFNLLHVFIEKIKTTFYKCAPNRIFSEVSKLSTSQNYILRSMTSSE